MDETTAEGTELESAIAGVYAGPLEEFVRRRDALAKELRSAGRREDGAVVKALRKPSRMAWALDAVALDARGTMETLSRAVTATLEAQASGGDVRAAIGELRGAVRVFAGHASRTAAEAGHRIDEAALANAVLAVIGRPDAFDALRGGRLVDVPEAGGLDFLAGLPQPAAPIARPVESAPAADRAATEPAARETVGKPAAEPAARKTTRKPAADKAAREAARRAAAAEATAREALEKAASAVAAARARSEDAQGALAALESKLASAEERLRQAQEEVRTTRDERDRARQEARTAAAQLRDAESAAAAAERQLERAVEAQRAVDRPDDASG